MHHPSMEGRIVFRILTCMLMAMLAGLALAAPRALALNVVADDQQVNGYQRVLNSQYVEESMCVGLDCTVPESFGFDTLRLKENNTQIAFDDTSLSGAFPKNDWAIVANDSANGGREYLGFRDVTGGDLLPFAVEAGAPTNSLLVAPSGNVGVGTASPGSTLAVAGSLAQLIDEGGIESVQPVNGDEILDQLSELPLQSWQYTGDAQRHLGPTGQQFNAAFGLGDNSGYVAPADLGAVALAATKALAERQASDIEGLPASLQDLTASVRALQGSNAAVPGQIAAATAGTDTRLKKHGKALAGLRKQNRKLKKRLNRIARKVNRLTR